MPKTFDFGPRTTPLWQVGPQSNFLKSPNWCILYLTLKVAFWPTDETPHKIVISRLCPHWCGREGLRGDTLSSIGKKKKKNPFIDQLELLDHAY